MDEDTEAFVGILGVLGHSRGSGLVVVHRLVHRFYEEDGLCLGTG